MADAYSQMVLAQQRLSNIDSKQAEEQRLNKKATRNAYIGLTGKLGVEGLKLRKEFLNDDMLGKKTNDGQQMYTKKTGGKFGESLRRHLLPNESDYELTTAGKKYQEQIAEQERLNALDPGKPKLDSFFDDAKPYSREKYSVAERADIKKPDLYIGEDSELGDSSRKKALTNASNRILGGDNMGSSPVLHREVNTSVLDGIDKGGYPELLDLSRGGPIGMPTGFESPTPTVSKFNSIQGTIDKNAKIAGNASDRANRNKFGLDKIAERAEGRPFTGANDPSANKAMNKQAFDKTYSDVRSQQIAGGHRTTRTDFLTTQAEIDSKMKGAKTYSKAPFTRSSPELAKDVAKYEDSLTRRRVLNEAKKGGNVGGKLPAEYAKKIDAAMAGKGDVIPGALGKTSDRVLDKALSAKGIDIKGLSDKTDALKGEALSLANFSKPPGVLDALSVGTDLFGAATNKGKTNTETYNRLGNAAFTTGTLAADAVLPGSGVALRLGKRAIDFFGNK